MKRRQSKLPPGPIDALTHDDNVTSKASFQTSNPQKQSSRIGLVAGPPIVENDGIVASAGVADDHARPGAIRVSGFNSEQLQVFSADEEIEDEGTSGNTSGTRNPNDHVVAEVVGRDQLLRDADEDQLIQELMSRNLVSAEIVTATTEQVPKADILEETLENDIDGNIDKKHPGFRNRFLSFAILIAVLVVAAVVVTAVVVSQSTKKSNPLTPGAIAPTTAPFKRQDAPTSAPFQRQGNFRSLLLSHNVSHSQDLFNQSTSQYQALNWIANDDPATLNITTTSFETIIERYVLAVIYFGTNGNHWDNQLHFLSAGNICSWRNAFNETGAFCSESEVLQELTLASNFLSGTIPTELGRLSSLTHLDLADNQLTGTIPSELSKLSNLSYLEFAVNQLVGTIPTELGNLSSLTSLILTANQLTGTIPTELGNKLSSLNDMSLFENQLSGEIPTVLGRLSNLTSLELYSNELDGTIPTELGNLINLTILEIEDNQLTGTIPSEIGLLTSLSFLDLSNNTFMGTVSTDLGALTHLIEIHLDHNNLTGNLTAVFCTGSPQWNHLTADCNTSKIDCICCTTCY